MCLSSHLFRMFAVILTISLSFQILNAQDIPYEVVTVNGQPCYKYKVQPGEGVYAISRIFSVSVAEILRHNPEANSGLKVGQEILVPATSVTTASGTFSDLTQSEIHGQTQPKSTDQNITFSHTVISGETVYSISKMYNTTVEEVHRLNPSSRDGIAEGQVLIIPQRRIISEEKEDNYRYHTILPKETLYSVSRTYSLKPEDVILANPGLSVETFQIGKTIRIPFFESHETVVSFEEQITNITHKVSRGETLHSLARKYNVDVADIRRLNPFLKKDALKTNMELLIPVKRSAVEGISRKDENHANSLLTKGVASDRIDMINVALLLPLLDETGNGHLRLQEYYEGFLLAVKEYKERGGNLMLYVFEIGKGSNTKKLESLLETMEMQSLHLIVGGVSDAQIKMLSDFSKSRNIKYVVPFSQSNGEVLNNGNIFQVNSLSQVIQSKATKVFLDTFRGANLIFVNGGDNDKAEFVMQLQNELRKKGTRYGTISNSSTLDTTILSFLATNRENVIIPTSGDSNMLRSLLDELVEVQEANSSYTIRLFGYPEWQTYSSIKSEYYRIGVYLYSQFFVDEKAPAVINFNNAFRTWYGRDPLNTYPDYAMWGYDTALFFLTAFQRFGSHFEYRIDQLSVNSLQFAFNFERMNNWGGFVNTGLYLVFYDTNGNIIKMDRSR